MDSKTGSQYQKVHIRVDCIDADNPLLLSRRSLKTMKANICFTTSALTLPNHCSVKLRVNAQGHLLIPVKEGSRSVRPLKTELKTAREASTEEMLTPDQLKKIHVQLGHATESSLVELLKLHRELYDSSFLHRIVEECSRKLPRPNDGSPIANIHCELDPCHSIALDVWYPKSQSHPF